MLSAVVVGLIGSPALVGAATGVGARLEIGKANSVNASTTLSATTISPAFQLKNLGTGAGLAITVKPGKAPITVNADAGKATNLNADKLDGLDGSAFQRKLSDINELNGVACAPDSWLLVMGPTSVLECVRDVGENEPNDSAETATDLLSNVPIKARVGGTDVDWYSLIQITCMADECAPFAQVYGAGVKMDLYRDGIKVLSNVTSFGYLDPFVGTPPVYQVRVFAPSLTTSAVGTVAM